MYVQASAGAPFYFETLREVYVKGGMLIPSIVCLEHRVPMDSDTTLRNLPLAPKAICSVLEQIRVIALDEDVTFDARRFTPSRKDAIYGEYHVVINARFDTLLTPLSIDTSIGEVITSHTIRHNSYEILTKKNLMNFVHTISKQLWQRK